VLELSVILDSTGYLLERWPTSRDLRHRSVLGVAILSLTWDRGLEMAQHQSFTVATDVKVYFCDPQSLWQRGSNENTNGLLRQYLPKKIDFSSYSQSDLDQIALRLNQRPRKTLGFETPESRLQASVAPQDARSPEIAVAVHRLAAAFFLLK
jgi:IS30 family transposase